MRVEIQQEEMGLPYAQLTELIDHSESVQSQRHARKPTLGSVASIATKSRNRNDGLEIQVRVSEG